MSKNRARGPRESSIFDDPESAGVVALLVGIVQRAVRDLTQYKFDGDVARRECAYDAWLWFVSDDLDHFTSFCSICRIINIDPGFLRSRLVDYMERGKEEDSGCFFESGELTITEDPEGEAEE